MIEMQVLSEGTWVTWLRYSARDDLERALRRRDGLVCKGYTARVVDDGKTVARGVVCVYCGDTHNEPFDGSCLL